MFALQHQVVRLLPQVLVRDQVREVLVLLGHGVVDGDGHEHAGRGRLGGGGGPAGQLAAAVARGLAAHAADAAGRRGRGRQGRGCALSAQLADLVGLDRGWLAA